MRCPSFAIVPGSIVADAGGRHADDHHRARPAQQQRALFDRAAGPDRDDDVVGAAPAGEREDGGDGVLRCRVDGVRRAEGPGRRELDVRHVDRDDRGRTGVDGTLHGVQPHAAGSDHDHRCPWLDCRRC